MQARRVHVGMEEKPGRLHRCGPRRGCSSAIDARLDRGFTPLQAGLYCACMARMTVVYRRPADPESFDRHYREVHVPLVKKLPGLRGYDVSTGEVPSPTGDDVYLVATLHFDSLDALRAALATPEGRACAEDRRVMAPGDRDVLMLLYDTENV